MRGLRVERRGVLKVSKKDVSRYIYGVGYNSGGVYKSRVGGIKTYAYTVWYDMIRRCYSKAFHVERPSHENCTVYHAWLDFQVFAEWYESQPFTGEGTQLDKDILVKGNSFYSPDTCLVVPKEINMLFVRNKNKSSGLPHGVRRVTNSEYYQVNVSNKGVNTYIGSSRTVEGAFLLYKREKESHVKNIANQYKDQIDPRAYNALMSWEVNIDE